MKRIGFLILSIFLLFSFYVLFMDNNSEKTPTIVKPIIEEKEVVKEISLIAVGDALLHDGVYNAARKNNVYDFKYMLKHIKEIVEPYDIAFYNQETILGGTEIGLSTYPRFNSPYEFGNDMIDTGFNLVSRANNHTLDRGEVAIINADNYWKVHPEIYTAGSYISQEDKDDIKIFKKNDITYAMLAYTTLTNGLKAPSGKEFYVDTYSNEKALSDINKIKGKVDIIIVSMHWGNEYVFKPVASQIDIANYLSSLGVNIILGHHPHVIEPVTYVGNTLVIYSMGNFISAQTDLMKKIGLMVNFKIKKTTYKGEVKIEINNIEGTLLYNPNSSTEGKYVIYPFDLVNESILKNYKATFEQYSNYVKIDDTITIKPIK